MTNRQRYQKTFGALHVSDERLREVYFMEKSKKTMHIGRAILIAACVTALLTVSAFAANEATDGLVFREISVWISDTFSVSRVTHNDDGSYTITTEGDGDIVVTVNDLQEGAPVTAEDGTVFYVQGSGVEYDGETMRAFEVSPKQFSGE